MRNTRAMFKGLSEQIVELLKALFEKWEVWLILIIFFGSATFFFSSISLWQAVVRFTQATWWLWTAIILSKLFVSIWKYWRQEKFKEELTWKMLEILIPREHTRTPKSMEQVLRAIHSLRNAPGDFSEHYFEGEVPRWFSLEAVSFSGEIRLFVRFYSKQRPLIEAAFFSHYPDVELADTEDYTDRFPQNMDEVREQGMDIWGTELILEKEAAYPIVSYRELMDEIDEERQVDPFSSILEVLAKAQKGEIVGIQIIAYGIDNSWREKWEPLVEQLKEKTAGKKVMEGEDVFSGISSRTPGETDIIRAVEKNLEKPAFEVIIRYIYFSPLEIYYSSYARRGLRGAFQQYNSLGLNGFRDNYATGTRTRMWHWPHVFSKKRGELRKERLLYNFLHREMPPEDLIGRLFTSKLFNWNFPSRTIQLNTESLATIFHPPISIVLTAPHVHRRESKRAGPPSGLPIFGEEEEIEKFQ